jgi:uncharacterized protein (TIGR00288 family)
MGQSRTRVALLIDGENSTSALIASLLAEAEKLGEVIIRRVYGNWSLSSMHGWQESARHYGLEQRHHGQTASGKNATDIALTVDAMDILHSGTVDHFCLATSDSDYTPLVARLRSAGCTVIGIGKPTTPIALQTACTAFIALDQLAQPVPGIQRPTASTPPQKEIPLPVEPLALLMDAYENVAQREEGEWVRLSDIGTWLKQTNALFRPSTYGHKDLLTFVKAYPNQLETRKQASKGKPVVIRRKQAPASAPLVLPPPLEKATAQLPSRARKKAAILPPTGEPIPQSSQVFPEGLAALLTQAYQNAATTLHEEWVPIPNLSVALKKLDPPFTAKAYGYKNLPTLVQKMTDLFRTRKQTEGEIKHIEVWLLPGR